MAKLKRRQYFVDPKVQGALVLRLIGYWAVIMVTTTAMILCWRFITGPASLVTDMDGMWFYYGPAIVSSFLLLPLLVIDCVRMSNRFAGPLYRLRRCMRELSAGMPVPPIHFREGDFWLEVADEFNAVSAKLQRLEEELAEARGETPFADEAFHIPTTVNG